MTVQIDKNKIKATFIIAENLTQDIIIGVDILKPNKCVVDYANNTLSCGNATVNIKTMEPSKPKLIRAIELIELAPYTQQLIWTKCNSPNKQIYIKPVKRSTGCEIIAEVQEDGEYKNHIPILLKNPTATNKVIRKGDVIASISSVEVVQTIKCEEDLNEFMKNETTTYRTTDDTEQWKLQQPWKPSQLIKFNNKSLDNQQKLQLKNLVDEYWMIFSRNDEDVGRIKEKYGTHDIKIYDSNPIRQRAYKTPNAKEPVVNECLNKMSKMKIIEPSDSDWASPIVLVKKPDGSERFCVDYRKLNAITIKDSFPMPSVESKLNKLQGCTIFTSLDCTSGYWQIKLWERAKQLATFICNKGLYSFNFMPFGLCNAGATFQRIIEKIIRNLDNSSAYIDDILTYSQNFEIHLEHLKLLFERLKEANVKVKTTKCKIGCDSLMFLGYKISTEGVTIDDSRIKVLQKYPKPTKAKHVKQFIGLAGFYRQFIQNFASIIEPLNRLTRKHVKFDWSDECNQAFEQIIHLLTQIPILKYPNFNKTFYLATDASKTGIGSVLGQKDDEDKEHAIYYASRSLNKAERNYSTIERELLAIIHAVDKFRYYLYGKQLTIITDHNPLTYLKNIT